MAEKENKYLGNKIIIMIAVSFCIMVSAITFYMYYLFKNNSSSQVERNTTASFNFFCKTLDNTFLNMEKCGRQYCEEITNAMMSGELLSKYEILTRALLFANSDISDVTICLLPEANYPNLISFNYYMSDKNITSFTEFDTTSAFYHTLLLNPTFANPMKYRKKCWSDPHYSIFISGQPIVGTLSVPIIDFNDGKVYGIIALTVRMSKLDNHISNFNLNGSSYNILLGNYGNIGIHPLEKYLMIPTDYGYNISLFNMVDDGGFEDIDVSNQNMFDILRIDSLGAFKCVGSLAFSYRLVNNWRFLTLFDYNLIDEMNSALIEEVLLILVICFILFFIVMITGVNKVLDNFKRFISQLVSFAKYDILDWKLQVVRSNDDMEILTTTFNKLYRAYIEVQNKFTDILVENNKLIYTEAQTEERIKYAIQYESDSWKEQRQHLTSSLNNMMEFVQLGKIICSTLSIEDISKAVYEHLSQLIPIVFFGIYIYNQEKETLDCEKGILNGNVISNFSLKIIEKNTIAVRCFDTNETISISNFDVEYRHYLFVNAYNPLDISCASQYYAPITDAENILGLFSIQCREKNVFKNFNIEFLDTLNTYLNMSMHNILSYRALKISLDKTKSVQSKLIQSERMASVGQLSAGIAHEIKNPLNFVINFSGLANSLVKDIGERINEYKSKPDSEIFEDIEDMMEDMKLDLSKIEEHGKRVDKIIKNMLVHSRNESGEFALTNINNLVNEYSKLAYHGLRATETAFNITLTYNLDESIGPIFIVPNNISRVIINIATNACYAVYSKFKKCEEIEVKNYIPQVTVTTTDLDEDYIEIRIRDNGVGIPEKNQTKIFTPFFTTKKVGEGTGLGLSICYEIIVQEHNGEISFTSEEDEYTEFLIKLPKKHKYK